MRAQTVAMCERPTKRRFVLIVVLLITIMVAYFDRVNISILIADEHFLKAMGIADHPSKAGLLMTVFLIAYGLGNVFLSSLGDYLGPRRAMLLAVVTWGIAMFMGGIAPTLAVMLLSRFLLGIGEGIHFPMQSTYVKAWFPKKERAKANASWFIGTSLAPAVAMPFFSWLVPHTSWHISFFTCTVVGFVPLYLIWRFAPDTPRQCKFTNLAEITYIENGQEGETTHGPKPAFKTLLRENLHLLKGNPLFWMLVIYYSVHNIVYWGLLTWLPAYLKSARGFSWSEMGVLASLPFILSIACKLFAGWASDIVGRRAPFCIVASLGAALGLYLSAQTSNNMLAAISICFGMGVLTLGAPMTFTMLQEMVPAKAISLGAGIMNGLSFLCASSGPLIMGFSMSASGSFSGALYVLMCIALIGTAASLVLVLRKY